MDINKIWLSGLVMTNPNKSQLTSKTPIATFELRVREHFCDKDGKDCYRSSYFIIESLGKSVERTMEIVRGSYCCRGLSQV
jgi:hypothetical protein